MTQPPSFSILDPHYKTVRSRGLRIIIQRVESRYRTGISADVTFENLPGFRLFHA